MREREGERDRERERERRERERGKMRLPTISLNGINLEDKRLLLFTMTNIQLFLPNISEFYSLLFLMVPHQLSQ